MHVPNVDIHIISDNQYAYVQQFELLFVIYLVSMWEDLETESAVL